MTDNLLDIKLTSQEASALSLAAISGGKTKNRSEALESGRKKLRVALDGHREVSIKPIIDSPKSRYSLREMERYVNTEC